MCLPARTFSLACNGVMPGSLRSAIIVLPRLEYGPTAVTRYVPTPSTTLAPERRNGSIFATIPSQVTGSRRRACETASAGIFLTTSDSPVDDASSQLTLYPWISTPSTGITSPCSRIITSPTSTSWTETFAGFPDRIIVMYLSSFFLFSTEKRLSFCQSFSAPTMTTTRMATMIATPSTHSTRAPVPSSWWPSNVRYRPRASETAAATLSRMRTRSWSAIQASARKDFDFRSRKQFSPKIRRRSA